MSSYLAVQKLQLQYFINHFLKKPTKNKTDLRGTKILHTFSKPSITLLSEILWPLWTCADCLVCSHYAGLSGCIDSVIPLNFHLNHWTSQRGITKGEETQQLFHMLIPDSFLYYTYSSFCNVVNYRPLGRNQYDLTTYFFEMLLHHFQFPSNFLRIIFILLQVAIFSRTLTYWEL